MGKAKKQKQKQKASDIEKPKKKKQPSGPNLTVEELSLTIDESQIKLNEGDIRRIVRGNNKIMYDVGTQYYELKNYKRAMDWFQKARRARHPSASIEIAKLFYYAKGTERDLDQAKKYFKKGRYAAKEEVAKYLARIEKEQNKKKA